MTTKDLLHKTPEATDLGQARRNTEAINFGMKKYSMKQCQSLDNCLASYAKIATLALVAVMHLR